MRLKSVRIENFKQFRRLDIELGALDCLVGPNNCGKTTLLQALALFDFCIHHCLERKNGELRLRHRTIPPEQFYVLPVADPMDLWTDRKAMEGKQQRVVTVAAVFDQGREVRAELKLDHNRFGIGIDTEDDQDWFKKLLDFRAAYLPVFSVFLAQEERRTPAVIDDELSRGRVHGVIRNLLLDLKARERHEELIAILKRAFPALERLDIEFDEVSDRYIRVTYTEMERPKAFDVFSAGSGFQQFLYLFGFILLKQPSVILLDEPDVHLHGSLQRALLCELRNLVAQGKQVLVATHSRDLIQGVDPEDILALDEPAPRGADADRRSSEQCAARRLAIAFDVYDTLERLGSMEPSQLPLIQAHGRVLVVEDREDWTLLAIFCNKCLEPRAWQQIERRLALCYSKGNPCGQDMERLRGQLQQIVGPGGRPIQMFVVADRDYEPNLEALRRELPSNHIAWHVWDRAEIENYLLCRGAIIRLIRGESPQPVLWERQFVEVFERLIDESRDSANDHLVKAFDAVRRRRHENWDASTMSRMAREYLQSHWETQRLALADAKEIVLPGVKRWFQEQRLGQFSNKALAEAIRAEELPGEVHGLARELARFVGVPIP